MSKRDFYRKQYIDLLLSEALLQRPISYVSFQLSEKRCKSLLQSIENLIKNGYESIIYCWELNQEALFKSPILSFILEHNSEESDTLASFNPTTNPFEMCINMTNLNKNLSKDNMLDFIHSDKFYVLLSHEVCHWQQTITYGVPVMCSFVKQQGLGQYMNSPIELEACIFMTLEDACLHNKRIFDFESLISYASSIEDVYLKTAKDYILSNKKDVKEILKHNESFLTESIKELEEENFDLHLELVAVPVNKPMGYWKKNLLS